MHAMFTANGVKQIHKHRVRGARWGRDQTKITWPGIWHTELQRAQNKLLCNKMIFTQYPKHLRMCIRYLQQTIKQDRWINSFRIAPKLITNK